MRLVGPPIHKDRAERRKVGTLPTTAPQTPPLCPALPATPCRRPPWSHNTTGATRSTQFGCGRLAHRGKRRFQPPTEKPYKIQSLRAPAKSSQISYSQASTWKYQMDGSVTASWTRPKHPSPIASRCITDGGRGLGPLFFTAPAVPLVKFDPSDTHFFCLFPIIYIFRRGGSNPSLSGSGPGILGSRTTPGGIELPRKIM